jgi:ABC-type glutathione transport system ATPase component
MLAPFGNPTILFLPQEAGLHLNKSFHEGGSILIRIKALRKFFTSRHGVVEALRGIDLEVAEKEFCVLLGPSGCGKTTTLRSVAGLERPDGGEIEIAGSLVSAPAKGIYVSVLRHLAAYERFQQRGLSADQRTEESTQESDRGKSPGRAQARPFGRPGESPRHGFERRAAAAGGDGPGDRD